jgi:hypothetical protein
MNNEPIFVKTGLPEFDDLIPKVKAFLEQDILELNIDGEIVKGYRSPDAKSLWIRDHSDMMRAAKYFETDLKSTVNHFALTQASNGRIFDYVTTHPEKLPCEKENWTKYVRVPVEADVEYRFIKAAWLSWQACGDDEWILSLIPAMEKALHYIFNNKLRVDEVTGLVKRAYTIDTWDFAYTAGKHSWLQFQIDDHTFWGISHGDNSGYYEALCIMESLYTYFISQVDGTRKSLEMSHRMQMIRRKTNEVCWNGRFYTHFVKITPVVIDGVDEANQLSLSNPMAINRGLASHEQAVSILNEYISREKKTNAFAGWFSIEPPFPDGIFGDEKLVGGAYINGGIFPLVGGELAMAAFNHGFESYGVEILKKYYHLISRKNETFLWYFPDGTPCSEENSTSPEAMPTDGWGSSAMAWAFVEGLAGIEDQLKRFSKIKLSPRWLAAGRTQAEVHVGYPLPDANDDFVGVDYRFNYTPLELVIQLHCNAGVDFHVLVSSKDIVSNVLIDDVPTEFQMEMVEQSQYVNFSSLVDNQAEIRINFKG